MITFVRTPFSGPLHSGPLHSGLTNYRNGSRHLVYGVALSLCVFFTMPVSAERIQTEIVVDVNDGNRANAQSAPESNALEVLSGRAREGERYAYRVRLTSPSDQVVNFKTYTRRGTAINGSDFYGVFRKLSIPPGQTEVSVPVVILDDTEVESDEIFYQSIASASVPIRQRQATTTVEDNDQNDNGRPPVNYAENLRRLKASPWRNKNEDASPFRSTPSANLYDEPALYGTARDHLTRRGYYNGPVYYDTGYYPGNGAGTFRASCEVSHFSYDDPMVRPGQPETAHLHMFMGNTDTNAFSTYDTLINSGGSTCNGLELNRTAYWVPAVFDGIGNVVLPFKALFYYKTEQAAGIGNVREYPENLQLLAGKKNNIQNNLHLATWRCNNIYNGVKFRPSATIPKCPAVVNGHPGAVELMIFFDYCWNGDESSIGDYRANRDRNFAPPSHYWHSSICPDTHPVLLPALTTHIFFDIRPGDDTSKWFLSSDVNPDTGRPDKPGGTTAHADWIGAWNKQINAEWVANCNNVLNAECAAGTLADTAGNPESTARALRMRNDFITGYANDAARMPVAEIFKSMCSADRVISPANGGSEAAFCRPR